MTRGESKFQIEFLRKLQRLLDEGDFTSTYKFSLLNALADLAVEKAMPSNGVLEVTFQEIAEKFARLYWPQTLPFASGDQEAEVLLQNNGQQAIVVNLLLDQRQNAVQSLDHLMVQDTVWKKLLDDIGKVIVDQPLYKLQTIEIQVGGKKSSITDDFLYGHEEVNKELRMIRMRPGVAGVLRAFHGLILNMVRGAWIDKLRRIRTNQLLIGADSQLDVFLFGQERGNLEIYRDVLHEHQHSRCFYCDKDIRSTPDVDHFIPWSRYPIDLAHNFVLAHPACNRKKRDHLAHCDYLSKWRELHLDSQDLSDRLTALSIFHSANRSRAIASWAYGQLEAVGGHVWRLPNEFIKLRGEWRQALLLEQLITHRAAEDSPHYDLN